MRFGEKLFVLRKQRGMTQLELAEKLGVSRQAVSRWESGAAFPSSGNLIGIGKLFDVSVNTLIDENSSIKFERKEESKKEIQNVERTKIKFIWEDRRLNFLSNILISTIMSVVIICFVFDIGRNKSNDVGEDRTLQEETLTTQEEVIFSKSWSADGVGLYVERRDGTIEKVPEFSELFPGWSIPESEANQEIDQTADHFDITQRSVISEKKNF